MSVFSDSNETAVMDWPLDDPAFSGEDLDTVFTYESRGRTGVCRFAGDEVRILLEQAAGVGRVQAEQAAGNIRAVSTG